MTNFEFAGRPDIQEDGAFGMPEFLGKFPGADPLLGRQQVQGANLKKNI
jgi:hypothetical protein